MVPVRSNSPGSLRRKLHLRGDPRAGALRTCAAMNICLDAIVNNINGIARGVCSRWRETFFAVCARLAMLQTAASGLGCFFPNHFVHLFWIPFNHSLHRLPPDLFSARGGGRGGQASLLCSPDANRTRRTRRSSGSVCRVASGLGFTDLCHNFWQAKQS